MPGALENARKKRDELAKDYNNLLARADHYKRMIARVDQFIQDYETFESDELPLKDPFDSLPPMLRTIAESEEAQKPKNTKKEDVASAARRLIKIEGRPISRPSLLTLLINQGLVIGGGAPETVLSTMLWRTRDTHGIIHLRNLGYWLKEEPWADAHYNPEFDGLIGVEDDAPNDVETDDND